MSENERETGLGYGSDTNANEVVDIDKKVNLVQLFQLSTIIDQYVREKIEVDTNIVQFKQVLERM